MSILVVDDSEDIRLLIKTFLKSAGYKDVFMASSAAEALALLGIPPEEHESLPSEKKDIDVDLILLDVVMPDMGGIEFCRIVKASEQHKDIPVVMTTAVDKTSMLQEAFNAGAIDYLTKPLNKVELVARVHSLLKLKAETDQRKARELELVELNKVLQSVNEQLKRLSSLDGLTGISNRRSFDERLEEEWNRERRSVVPLSLVFLDIDFFKPYNDTYGHLAGDECLISIAKSLKKTLHRPADSLARYGGEEFVVILPETSEEGALKIAEDLREAVESMGMQHEASKVADHVTVSLGTATMIPSAGVEPSTLVDSADKALYAAKEEGRNRVKAALCQ
jgi:diguanylate cyclase (GGDEF)-like protein